MNESKELPASQLWTKLFNVERPSKKVDFPRTGMDGHPVGQLLIRVLTQEEQMQAAAAAEKFAREILKEAKKNDFGYERLYSDAVAVEVLYRACRDVDNVERPTFPGPKALRQALTTDECGKLFEHYLTVQLELGPIVTSLSEEELEAWIDRLVEGGSAYPLDLLSSDLQHLLLLHMAYQLRSSPTDNSSVGLQPDTENGPTSSDGLNPEPPDDSE